jgi:hypothetical protein
MNLHARVERERLGRRKIERGLRCIGGSRVATGLRTGGLLGQDVHDHALVCKERLGGPGANIAAGCLAEAVQVALEAVGLAPVVLVLVHLVGLAFKALDCASAASSIAAFWRFELLRRRTFLDEPRDLLVHDRLDAAPSRRRACARTETWKMPRSGYPYWIARSLRAASFSSITSLRTTGTTCPRPARSGGELHLRVALAEGHGAVVAELDLGELDCLSIACESLDAADRPGIGLGATYLRCHVGPASDRAEELLDQRLDRLRESKSPATTSDALPGT